MKSLAAKKKRGRPLGLLILLALFPLVMFPLSKVDYGWTLWLNHTLNQTFGLVMKRTFFEDGALGGSDPAIFFLLAIIGFYFAYSKKRKNPFYTQIRPFLGFVLFSALVAGLGLVQSLKWTLGRARPDLVLDGKFPFTHWFEFGPHFVSDGVFFGSFPSGHTATVFLLITLSYWLMGSPENKPFRRASGGIWGLFVFGLTGMMIAGRSTTLDHWLTDSIGVTLLIWISVHFIFFKILRIPEQIRYVSLYGSYLPLARYWELKLFWRLLLIILGSMAMVIGLRSVLISKMPGLIFLTLPGIVLVFYFSRSLRTVYRKSMESWADKQ